MSKSLSLKTEIHHVQEFDPSVIPFHRPAAECRHRLLDPARVQRPGQESAHFLGVHREREDISDLAGTLHRRHADHHVQLHSAGMGGQKTVAGGNERRSGAAIAVDGTAGTPIGRQIEGDTGYRGGHHDHRLDRTADLRRFRRRTPPCRPQLPQGQDHAAQSVWRGGGRPRPEHPGPGDHTGAHPRPDHREHRFSQGPEPARKTSG